MSEETKQPEDNTITVQDLLGDDLFLENFDKVLRDLIHKRVIRPAPKPGFKYLRDWYDKIDHNQLNSGYLLPHVEDVMAKKSNLSRDLRMVINHVFTEAANKTFATYQAQLNKERLEQIKKEKENETT